QPARGRLSTHRHRPQVPSYQETSLTISAYSRVRCRGMGVKIAVVGGGSTYTPELIEGFHSRRDRLPVDELVLHDIDDERLEVVGGLAHRILQKHEWPGRPVVSKDRERALDGATFVIVQARGRGWAARLVDEAPPIDLGGLGL